MASLVLEQFQGGGLEPFDLSIEVTECVTLTGESGSGKTRLLRAIADLDPNRGEARVGSRSIHELTAPEWRQRVGLLATESHWWQERVGDHFVNDPASWLQALHLKDDALQWSVSRLSSGERQRLALARLLDRQPEVLLLDEPTANLDPQNSRRMERLILQYARQREAAVLWVSHDPEQRRRIGDRHLVIRNNQLREVGKP